MQKLVNILFWSVISAAFIGPGTITTAAAAGAGFGLSLLWALLFSTIACLVLQEASARLTICSGRELGEAIRRQFAGGFRRAAVLFLVVGGVVFGCAAYEAGNMLGSVAGAALGTALPPKMLTLFISLLAGGLLWFGSTGGVARVMGGLVAVMGICFLVTAILMRPAARELFSGLLVPRFPSGAGLLVLGLIGTTVVPYNLFLGSGLARGAVLMEMRFGLSVAVLLGGLISMGVLVVGTAVSPPLAYDALAVALAARLGSWAGAFFALGLFAAGFSSAITAPLAAAITTRSLFADVPAAWPERSRPFRAVWLGVLATGVFFGLSDIRPIPAIILAQAFNGMLLPFVAVFLLLAVNDGRIMGAGGLNGRGANLLMSLVVAVTLVLGILQMLRAVSSALSLPVQNEAHLELLAAALGALALLPIAAALRRLRRNSPP